MYTLKHYSSQGLNISLVRHIAVIHEEHDRYDECLETLKLEGEEKPFAFISLERMEDNAFSIIALYAGNAAYIVNENGKTVESVTL
jgi:hypothetical protein